MPISVLIIGQTDREESQPLATWLAASLQPSDTRHFRDLTTALQEISRANWIPDLNVIVQSSPDEFSPSEIASLFAFAPLARVVVAYGAWCESDGRNRHLWPLAVRVALPNATGRIEREWRLLHEARGIEPLPLSASREEVFAADHPPITIFSPLAPHSRGEGPGVRGALKDRQTSSPQTVLVVSPDPAYRRYLNELLAFAGHTVCTTDMTVPDSHPTAILFDADPWDAEGAARLRSRRERHPQAQFIVLMSQPNPLETTAILDAGASSILPKLGDQTAILNAVSDVIPVSRPA